MNAQNCFGLKGCQAEVKVMWERAFQLMRVAMYTQQVIFPAAQ